MRHDAVARPSSLLDSEDYADVVASLAVVGKADSPACRGPLLVASRMVIEVVIDRSSHAETLLRPLAVKVT